MGYIFSAILYSNIIVLFVYSILETACHDSQFGVQECCLTALRSMASRPALRQVSLLYVHYTSDLFLQLSLDDMCMRMVLSSILHQINTVIY